MRIIAGAFKGRRLATPSWEGVRPTSDRLRETLFNVLAPYVEGARVVDGYAGTGAVGLEALSRGASTITFVESDRRAVALIERNATVCGASGRYTVVRGEFCDVAPALAASAYDLVFLDPPYADDRIGDALGHAARLVSADGRVVLERASRREPEVPAGLERVRDLRAGDSTLTIFRRAGAVALAEHA